MVRVMIEVVNPSEESVVEVADGPVIMFEGWESLSTDVGEEESTVVRGLDEEREAEGCG